MLEIQVVTESGERHLRPSPEELAGLVRRIGGAGDGFLVLQRVPDLPEVFAQVAPGAGGAYSVEYRDSATGQWRAQVDGPGTATAVLTGWARQETGWDADLEWELLFGPAPGHGPPELDLDAEDRELLEERVRAELAGGYTTRDQVAELAEDYLVTEDRRPVSHTQARALADWLWLERIAEQERWQDETDPERLTRAFEALEQSGITARENFACCRNCGTGEIGGEAAPGARGFVFFHSQCTEGAARGGSLMLLYGGFDGSARTTTAVGHEVVAALGAVGLRTRWNGDPSRAVEVTPLDWRRRLVG